MDRQLLPLSDYLARAGSELGVSRWFIIDQDRIDRFADVTEDHQFIHVDVARARDTPFGGTIAHGYLTLSLLSAMAHDVMPGIEGARLGVNYGINRLRFLAPVAAGKRIRGRFHLIDATLRTSGIVQSTVAVTVEIEGETKAALIAEWLTLAYL